MIDRVVGKVFNRYDVAAALCMSTGLIFFTLADSKVQPDFNLYGESPVTNLCLSNAVVTESFKA